MTIYELTEKERAVMRKLVALGLVVTIGKHARLGEDLDNALEMLKGIASACRRNGYDKCAVAVENFLEEMMGVKRTVPVRYLTKDELKKEFPLSSDE